MFGVRSPFGRRGMSNPSSRPTHPDGAVAVEPVVVPLSVTLEDIMVRRTLRPSVRREVQCRSCKGHGTASGRSPPPCASCKGSGSVTNMRTVGSGYVQYVQAQCPACSGRGSFVEVNSVCGSCRGARSVRESKVLNVTIPAGVENGASLRMEGEGSHPAGSSAAGDVVFVVEVLPHHSFRRVGDRGRHLVHEVSLPLMDALCGAVIEVKHLDGRVLRLATSPEHVLAPGSRWVVPQEGMEVSSSDGGYSGRRGDLIVVVNVDFPKGMDAELVTGLVAALREGEGASSDPTSTTAGRSAAAVTLEACKLSAEQLEPTPSRPRPRSSEGPRSSAAEGGRESGSACPQQ